MQFQERDAAILSAIYDHDGLLARRHLHEVFWPNAGLRAVQKRLSKLVERGYLARPTPLQRRTQPIPEPVYWLSWRGILWIAGQRDLPVEPPHNTRENQMRRLAKSLRANGLHWLREPRWNQLSHDLAVIDLHFAVERSVAAHPHLHLEAWHYESAFRAEGDTITYQLQHSNGAYYQMKRTIYPDSYFVIMDRRRTGRDLVARARFLLEMDNATHSNTRFGREKVAPGIAYIRSSAYRERFGDNSGRWLVVTTGATRMGNLMRQAKKLGGDRAGSFYFTTGPWLAQADILLDSVWRLPGRAQPTPLFPAR